MRKQATAPITQLWTGYLGQAPDGICDNKRWKKMPKKAGTKSARVHGREFEQIPAPRLSESGR